jgi:MATE family multidrug resistance protein
VRPNVAVNIISNIANGLLCWLLIFNCGYGWRGAAIARTLSVAIAPFLLIGYVTATGFTKRFWSGWSRSCLQGWKQFLSLSLPGTFQMCSEWWAFEFMALFAGWLPNAHTALASHTILFNITNVSFMLYLGLADATAVRVSIMFVCFLSTSHRTVAPIYVLTRTLAIYIGW